MSGVIIRKETRAGRITLNKPKALNALNHEMALEIETTLKTWRDDNAVALVAIDGAGDKAFCAGGDIQILYETGIAGDLDYGRRFWRDEYRLNAAISRYPKPYVAIMDGIVMGGGVGVSAHGSNRVVTDRSMVAMPEVSIGFLPDVGGTYLLSRAPGHIGEYLAMTGARMDAADCLYTGFADVYVPSDDVPQLIESLSAGDVSVIDRAKKPLQPGALEQNRAEIDACFGARDAAGVIAALADRSSVWAAETLKLLDRASPLSAACALEAVRAARDLPTLESCLALEYRFVHRSMEQADFLEGIRAQIIDKDRNPKWRHARMSDVGPDEVSALLAPLGEQELNL